jgi:hypothetical protein
MFVRGIYDPYKRPRRCNPIPDEGINAANKSLSSPRLSRRELSKQRQVQKVSVLKAGKAKLFEAIRGCGNQNWKALVPIAAPNSQVQKNATGLIHHATVTHAYVTKLITKNGRDDTSKSVAQEVAEETGCGIWQVTRWYRDFFRLIAPSPQPPASNLSAHITAIPSAPTASIVAPGRDGMGAIREVQMGDDATATTPEGGLPLAGSKAVYTWSDGTGRLEVVTIMNVHSQSEGEAITIFVPSIAREKRTVIERLDFRRRAIDDCLRVPQAPSAMARATTSLTAPCSARSASLTLNSSCFD